MITLSRVEADDNTTNKSPTLILLSIKTGQYCERKKSAYIDSEGNLIVIEQFDSKVLVTLGRVKTPADVTYQIWILITESNYKSDALKQAIEIMSKK